VAVTVTVFPGSTDRAESFRVETEGARTVTLPAFEEAPIAALRLTLMLDATGIEVTYADAVDFPAGTRRVTEAKVATTLLVTITVAPPAGAGLSRRTLSSTLAPPTQLAGLTVNCVNDWAIKLGAAIKATQANANLTPSTIRRIRQPSLWESVRHRENITPFRD